MGTSKHLWIWLALASAAVLSSLAAWRFGGATELAPSPVAERAPHAHVDLLPTVEELPARAPTERSSAPSLRGIRLSNELLERLKTPEAESMSVPAPSAQPVLAVQLPMELAGSDAWLQIVREGEDGHAIGARIDRDGVANFAPTWTGPATCFLGSDTWIADPAEVYVPNPVGYFDARPYVHVAQLAVRVPEGSVPPKGLLVACLRPKDLYTVDLDLTAAGQDVAVAFVHDELYVRLSAQGYRDQELHIRPGNHVVDLQPGFRVEIRIEGVELDTLEKMGVMAWLNNGDQVEMLHLKSTSTPVVLPAAGWWDVNLGKPFSFAEVESVWSPPKWSTRIHVDEVDAAVTLAPVWDEQ